MAVDTQQILQAAEKLGQMLKDHPAVERFKSAQKSVAEDAEASRLLGEFERGLEAPGPAGTTGTAGHRCAENAIGSAAIQDRLAYQDQESQSGTDGIYRSVAENRRCVQAAG